MGLSPERDEFGLYQTWALLSSTHCSRADLGPLLDPHVRLGFVLFTDKGTHRKIELFE